MKSKELNVLIIIVLAALLFIVFDCLKGKAGNLEPNAPPQSTMVTLGQISAQIEALSLPVKKVVRGVITIEKNEATGLQNLPSPVDPNHSVVLLNNAVVFNQESNPDDKWLARTGACLTALTETQISVQVEPHPAEQKVGYQIIEYK